jgi:hypothetical protein
LERLRHRLVDLISECAETGGKCRRPDRELLLGRAHDT